jgi:hypothetical protein
MGMEGFVLVEVDSTVGKLAESSLGLNGSGLNGVLDDEISLAFMRKT